MTIGLTLRSFADRLFRRSPASAEMREELSAHIAHRADDLERSGLPLGGVTRLLALGSAAGLLAGIAATKLLSYIVYQATPRDPFVLAGVVLTMLLLGLIAAWIPAQGALGADPVALLLEE